MMLTGSSDSSDSESEDDTRRKKGKFRNIYSVLHLNYKHLCLLLVKSSAPSHGKQAIDSASKKENSSVSVILC